ncbi:MAG: hypothetical protein FWF36_10370 [Propionibacteriaceae bacterium]|nr:hypothetical protein [Propionibacteriaceae bacterium]
MNDWNACLLRQLRTVLGQQRAIRAASLMVTQSASAGVARFLVAGIISPLALAVWAVALLANPNPPVQF